MVCLLRIFFFRLFVSKVIVLVSSRFHCVHNFPARDDFRPAGKWTFSLTHSFSNFKDRKKKNCTHFTKRKLKRKEKQVKYNLITHIVINMFKQQMKQFKKLWRMQQLNNQRDLKKETNEYWNQVKHRIEN